MSYCLLASVAPDLGIAGKQNPLEQEAGKGEATSRAALCSKPYQVMGEEQCALLKKNTKQRKYKQKVNPQQKQQQCTEEAMHPAMLRTASLSLLAAQSTLCRGWADLAVNTQIFHSREVLSALPLCPLCSWWFDLQPKATEALSEDRGICPSYFKCNLPAL